MSTLYNAMQVTLSNISAAITSPTGYYRVVVGRYVNDAWFSTVGPTDGGLAVGMPSEKRPMPGLYILLSAALAHGLAPVHRQPTYVNEDSMHAGRFNRFWPVVLICCRLACVLVQVPSPSPA